MIADVIDAPLFNTAAVVQRDRRPGGHVPRMGTALRLPQAAPQQRRSASVFGAGHPGHLLVIRADRARRGHQPRDRHAARRLTRSPRRSPSHQTPGAPLNALQADLGRALLALDAERADSVLAEAFSLYPIEDVCLHVLQPMLIDIGERWHAGEVSVAEEHYVSSVVRSRMFALLQAYQTGGNRGPLVFTACAPDEWHEVGVLLVSVFLARRGLMVRYLGPSLPVEGLAAIAAQHHPAAIVLSAQSPETARKLRASVTLLEASEPRPLLFFGGQAFNSNARLRARTPGTYIGPDAAAAAASVVEQVTNSTAASRRRARSASAGRR